MASGLLRLSETDPTAVKQYLLSRQMQPEIIAWKYFDTSFNGDRERGVVWVRNNQVAGFLGLIPFSIQKRDFKAECAWSCDWSVDPRQGAGTGLLLVKRARELYDGVFNLGGNENTRQIFPRLADRTIPGAGIALVLPLRWGAVFARLPQGLRLLLKGRQTIRRLPLRWVRAPRRRIATIERGLAPGIIRLMSAAPPLEWGPIYDAEFFQWQFCRCPAITCWSCWIASESPLRTAALVWRSSSSSEFWRLVFCGDTSDLEKLRLLVAAAVSFVYRQGAIAIFTVTSQEEKGLLRLFLQRGFIRHRSLAFYIMRGRSSALPGDEFTRLSFLDSDLAYRFEQDSASDDSL
jgi:hypothetical protein